MAKSRELTFGDQVNPIHQFPLRTPKGEVGQTAWLLGVFCDKYFSLTSIFDVNEIPDTAGVVWESLPYSDLWAALGRLAKCPKKVWLIGWRLGFALDAADFCGALERGEVRLPTIKSGKNKGKHGGRLTLNGRVVEVDVECGPNKIKLLDWANFGVRPPAPCGGVGNVFLGYAITAFAEFRDLMNAVGVKINKSTSAQLGWAHARRTTDLRLLSANRDGRTRAMERRAYFGGRCEAKRLGDIPGTTYSLDVHSCYATICRDELLPARLIEEYPCGIEVERIEPCDYEQWIADCVVSTDSADYPLRWQGSTVYPVGKFATSLAWPELQHALARGRVLSVSCAGRYEAEPVLSEYAEWYLGAREKYGDEFSTENLGSLKALFNASLGYTARQKYEWQPWDTQIGYPYWLGTARSPEDYHTLVSAQVLQEDRRWLRVAGEPREAVPFLHATICSYARVRLLEIFASARPENVLYCDTDGVLVTERGKANLAESDKWPTRFAHGLVTRFPPGPARIQGQKSYSVGSQTIQAGAPKTRYDGTLRRRVPTTEAGRVDADGRVYPFEFRFTGAKNEMV